MNSLFSRDTILFFLFFINANKVRVITFITKKLVSHSPKHKQYAARRKFNRLAFLFEVKFDREKLDRHRIFFPVCLNFT